MDLLNSVTAYRREMLQHRVNRKPNLITKSSIMLKSHVRRSNAYLFNWSHKIEHKQTDNVINTEPSASFKPFLSVDSAYTNGRMSLKELSPLRSPIRIPNRNLDKSNLSPLRHKIRAYKLDSASLLVSRIVQYVGKHFRIWKLNTEMSKKQDKLSFNEKAKEIQAKFQKFPQNKLSGKIIKRVVQTQPVSRETSPRFTDILNWSTKNANPQPIIIETVDEFTKSTEKWNKLIESESGNSYKRSVFNSMENPLSSGNRTGASSVNGKIMENSNIGGLSNLSSGIVKISVLLITVIRKIESVGFSKIKSAGFLNIDSLVFEESFEESIEISAEMSIEIHNLAKKQGYLVGLNELFVNKVREYFENITKPPAVKEQPVDVYSQMRNIRASRTRTGTMIIRQAKSFLDNMNKLQDFLNKHLLSSA